MYIHITNLHMNVAANHTLTKSLQNEIINLAQISINILFVRTLIHISEQISSCVDHIVRSLSFFSCSVHVP